MDEILGKLAALIEHVNSKSVVSELKLRGDEVTETVAQLTKGTSHLLSARRCFRRADFLMQKGYGELVEPEE